MDQISLEQFQISNLNPLHWNCKDNTIAINGESSIYIIQMRPSGELKRYQLLCSSSIKAILWGANPCTFVVEGRGKLHSVLFVSLSNGKIQAWAKVYLSHLNRWCLQDEIDVDGFQSWSQLQGELYVGKSNGDYLILQFEDGKFKRKEQQVNIVDEKITQIRPSQHGVALCHGPGNLSAHSVNSKIVKPILSDDFIGPLYLRWHGDDLIFIKYNQLYIFKIDGAFEQSTLFDTLSSNESLSSVIPDVSESFLWVLSFGGKIYKLSLLTKKLELFKEMKPGSNYIDMKLSSAGNTLLLISKNANSPSIVEILPTDNNRAFSEDLCGLWELKQTGGNIEDSLYFPLFSSNDSCENYIRTNVCDRIISSLKDAEIEIKLVWSAYKRFLDGTQGSWSILNQLKAETCPDCSSGSVPFESFTDAKCSVGHKLQRCAYTFRCIGISTAFEYCDHCDRKYLLGDCLSCCYCNGPLLIAK